MIPLHTVLPDLKRPKLPTLHERDWELRIKMLEDRVAKLERQRDRMELA